MSTRVFDASPKAAKRPLEATKWILYPKDHTPVGVRSTNILKIYNFKKTIGICYENYGRKTESTTTDLVISKDNSE